MNYSGVYSVLLPDVAVSTAITLIQVKAGADTSLEIIRAWCSQENTDTSDQQEIQIVRKTAAATVTSFTPILLSPNYGAAKAVGGTAATGHTATVEGTDGDIVYRDAFNLINGWLYVPTPEERIKLAGGDTIGLKLTAAPGASTNFTAGVIFGEI